MVKQRIYNGIEHLSAVLKDSKKVFLVCGNSFHTLNIKEDIENMGIPHVIFSDFTPNPLYEQVCKGVDLFQITRCDSILAVGGGSAIDVAKCIKLAVLAEEGEDALIPPLVLKQLPIEGSKIPFIAIPTTAGTGSESTHNAVMYYEGAKQTVTNNGVLPNYAILESSVLKTLPLYQKKCTMLDALCQGIESWWSVNSTDESKDYSKVCIELIMANWRKYIFENDDDAAANMMLAANYGGRAINIAQTTAAHAMSYKLTSLYKLPHGHAVAICLPEIWQYMLCNMDKCIDARGEYYLSSIFKDIAHAMGTEETHSAIESFLMMLRALDIQSPTASIKENELNILSTSVNPVRLKNNPVKLDEQAIIVLYNEIII